MKKLNILLPTTGLDIGGAETHVVGLAKQLKAMGHKPIIVSSGGIYEEELKGYNILHYYAPLNSKGPKDLWVAFSRLNRIVEEEKVDLIHAHGRVASLISKIVGIKKNTPFMTTAHALFRFSGLFKYFTFWGEEVISISKDVEAHLVNHFHVKPEKITVIENGIDMEKFSKKTLDPSLIKKLHLKEESLKIVYISRISGPLAVLANQLIGIGPALKHRLGDVEIIIVGDGEEHRTIKASADRINKQENCIRVLGKRTDIPQIVSLGDVVIAVSRTALEAMAMEKPVILAGGEGYMGLLSPENYELAKTTNFTGRKVGNLQSEQQLIDDIVAFFEKTPEERQALGRFGHEKVAREFSIEDMTLKTIQIYTRLLKKRGLLNENNR